MPQVQSVFPKDHSGKCVDAFRSIALRGYSPMTIRSIEQNREKASTERRTAFYRQTAAMPHNGQRVAFFLFL